MADIMIAIISFPNDPTGKQIAHQMFIAEENEGHLDLYSVSSILGKEKRVYGTQKERYVTILPPEDRANGFKVPSFIDCTKMYQIQLDCSMKLSALTQRTISEELRDRIKSNINKMKEKGIHETHKISNREFRTWNPRI